MKVVILAGGLGTRLSEYTHSIPKPMISINNKPLIFHIMKHYAKYGFKEFYIALGYKGNVIKKFFNKNHYGWKINLINTGLKTMTGGRLKRLKKYLGNDTFMMTYGDGLSDINLKKLLKFHKKNKKIATVTAVRPPVRFGEMSIKNSRVTSFKEKPEIKSSWINGGFFALNYKVFDYIKNDKISFEKEPMEMLSKNKNLMAYKHLGFWKCMDNLGDKNYLEKLYKENKVKPWKR